MGLAAASAIKAFMEKYNVSGSYDPNDPLTPIYANLVSLYASEAQFAHSPTRGNDVLIEGCLRARQILYYKNTPGDCPKQTAVSQGVAVSTLKYGSMAIGTGTSIAVSTGTIAATGAIGLASMGIGLAALPVIAILQHHAVAVAKEQGTLCAATGFFNAGCQSIIQANIDWKTAKQNFDAVLTQSLSIADATKQDTPGTCNAACMIERAMKALHDLFVMLYASAPASNPIEAPQGAAASTPATGVPTGGAAVIAGAGLAGMHFAGVF